MNIDFDFSNLDKVINKVYYDRLRYSQRYDILYGSAGSGKSHFAAQKYIIRVIAGFKTGHKHKILALRKTQPAVRKSVFALFQHYITEWGLKDFCKINKQEMIIYWQNDSQFICGGLDDPEKIKSIEGITGAWLEEATEFTPDDFKQIDLRIRGHSDSYKQIVLSFNPISKLSWIYKKFFIKKPDNCEILQTTYKDNRFLDEPYRQMLEGLKNEDETYYQIYALGEWGVLQNIIYNNWNIVDDMPDNPDITGYGVDFGYNNPSTILEISLKDKEVYINELLYESKLTNTDLIGRMETLCNKNLEIVADSAEPDRIKEISNAGFTIIKARKGKNSVKDGIDILKRTKIHITASSVNVKKELEGYKYKKDKDGNVLDEPVKFNDHAMDGMRYWGLNSKDNLGVSIHGMEDKKKEIDKESEEYKKSWNNIDREAIEENEAAWD